MRKLLLIGLVLICMAIPVSALDLEVPTVPEVRQSGAENFAQDLITVLRDAFDRFQPNLREAASVCLKVLAVVAVLAVFASVPGKSGADRRASCRERVSPRV